MFFLQEILQLPSKRWWLCTLPGHTIPLSHPLVRGAAQGRAWAQRAVPKPLRYPRPERCAGTAGLLSAVFFHQRPRRRGVRSGSLPGWAPSWKFSPIKLKWIIFKWHFHPVQAWSVSQHQRAFASVCFAPAPWCTSTSKVLQAPVAPMQGEHPNETAHPSYTKQDLVKYFLYRTFLHLNLLTVNFWNFALRTAVDRPRYAVHCKEINLQERPHLVKLIKRLYRVNWVWEMH